MASSSSSEGFKCSICLEFHSGSSFKDYFVTTPGGHVFHFSCIKKLIDAGHKCCPMCREHVNENNLTRLYGIECESIRPGKSKSSNSQTALENRNCIDNLGSGKPDYVFKIVLLGGSSVGKTSILKRFTTDEFRSDTTATTGCDLFFKMMEMGGRSIKLTMWDTVGQEKFRSVSTNCIRNAHGIFLVYDVSDMRSFTEIETWIKFVQDHAPSEAKMILIGNKLDINKQQRAVPQRHGKALANKLKLSFFETSAKESNNVEAAFRCLVGEIMESTVLNPDNENYDDNYGESYPRGSVSRSRSGCRIHIPSSASRHNQNDDNVYEPVPECLC